MPDKTMRECRWCGQPFMSHGTTAYCSDAHRRQRILEQNRRYRAENREGQMEYQRRYRAENREAVREKKRRYYAGNREKVLSYSVAYHRKRAAAYDAIRELGLLRELGLI